MEFTSPEDRGACAAALRMDAEGLRAQTFDDDTFRGYLEHRITLDLADRLDAKADELGPSWCILCGAWDAVPSERASHAEPCGLCGAPRTPRPHLRGILTDRP